MNGLRDSSLLRQQGLIDGEWRWAAAGHTIEVIDPATQHVLGTVPDMDQRPFPPRRLPLSYRLRPCR
ncbi:hypothetical protein AB9F46_35420, partial [Rhizobium leguminosarum]|uniref:hypothetical protein n=1 Tax=Rhizobium leguminosarum TaxID=384 RepID=UPI003F958C35